MYHLGRQPRSRKHRHRRTGRTV